MVTVETYQAPKGPIQCKNCQRFGHRKVILIPRGAWPVVAHTFRTESALWHKIKRGAPNVMPTTLLTIVVAVSGRSAGPSTLSELVLPVQRLGGLNAIPRRSLRSKSFPALPGAADHGARMEPCLKLELLLPNARPRQPNRVTHPWQRSRILPRTFLCLPSVARLLMS